ncbi:MAG: acyl-CoA dehydrogenase [Thermoanaerobaculia bacterium]
MLLELARRSFPRMSATEREALDAGNVWVEGSFFHGRPDWKRILDEPWPELSAEERAFVDGPVERACTMVDEWALSKSRVLPEAVWALLREERFLGLAIPKRFGGLEFSSLACSTIFGKLASRSLPLSAIVLIPNSVGPAELLLHYGTDAQRESYLPRLARGEEIPCFALTEPEAGSDAASITSRGQVFRNERGEPMLRLSWDKRYITLAPVATLIGLAVRLFDPEEILGRGVEPGITCVLVPHDTPGVEIGRHHDPMGVPFPNGPTSGRDVIVPVDQIIGGASGAGRGWTMLMEALSAGRAISLPAQSVAGAKTIARIAGAWAAVRRQFGLPIGRFAGIEEPLARIAALTYMMDAARVFTCGGIDRGARPSVVSAIVKHRQTELMRSLAADGMDILAGNAISRGPRNTMAAAWTGAPIGITVEGANILTRTLIIFGQGVVRCHPFVRRELDAAARGDAGALRSALFGHVLFVARNVVRAKLLSLTRGRLSNAPFGGATRRLAQRINWATAHFALLADLAMLSLGGELKKRGAISGRLADALSWLYFSSAALRRFEAEGRRDADAPLVRWSVEHALEQIQGAFEGIHRNLPGVVGVLLRFLWLPWLRVNPLGSGPTDDDGSHAAATILTPGPDRDRLTRDIFRPKDDEAWGPIEVALDAIAAASPHASVLRDAVRAGSVSGDDAIAAALQQGALTPEGAELLRLAEAARRAAIEVDSFSRDEYLG